MTAPQQNQNPNEQIIPGDPFGSIKTPVTNEAPLPQVVGFLHTRADTDSSQTAKHHTLGVNHNQSSPGDHIHDGRTSKLLMDGISITGSRGGNAALASLISELSQVLGFNDLTTP